MKPSLMQMNVKEYSTGLASEFSEKEIKLFKNILMDAGEVSKASFNGLIEKNPILLFCHDSTNIFGIGALKIPFENHKRSIFNNAKSVNKFNDYQYELGWIVVLEENQGIGKTITKELSERKNKIYATVRENNLKMIYILEKLGFSKEGLPYDSTRGNYKLLLYLKDDILIK